MAYSGFNQERQAEDLLAVQRRLLGDDAMAPAGQIAESIREKAALRAREEESLPKLLKSLSGQRQSTSREPVAVANSGPGPGLARAVDGHGIPSAHSAALRA